MPSIFINFRGRDQAGFASLLDRDLCEAFGRDAIFLSSRSIRPGSDFTADIYESLSSCKVLIAVIGPDWLRYGSLGNADVTRDWVRLEIAEAFVRGIRVVPVLVENAAMPSADQLPPDIAALSRCQYLRLHHRNIDHDLARVRAEIASLIGVRKPPADKDEAHAGRVRVFEIAGHPCKVAVVSGSIRDVRFAEVWVNSENSDMEMSRTSESTISGIIRYFGARKDGSGAVVEDVIASALAGAVSGRRPVAPCAAYVTESGALADSHGVRHIIHVASVSGAPGAGFQQVPRVAACVTNVLEVVDALASSGDTVRSIIFPLLGTGDGGAHVQPTVTAMLRAITGYLASTPDSALAIIYLLGYSNVEYRTLIEELTAIARPVEDQ